MNKKSEINVDISPHSLQKSADKFLLVASFPDSILHFRGPLIDALLEQGISLTVSAPGLSKENPVGRELLAKGVAVYNLPLQRTGVNPFVDVVATLYLLWLMRKLRPRWVLGYTVKPVVYGTIAARLAGVPYRFCLITGLGYAFQEKLNQKRSKLRLLVQFLYRIALKGSSKVFFQNPDDEALFRSFGILSNGTPSIVVNGSGVDVSQYSVRPMPKKLIFLLIARLLGDKGIREYVNAARMVRLMYPHITFDLVGWIDPGPDAIQQYELDAWVLEGVINYLGRLDDVRPAIANCSVYVLPSYREGTPRTVLEAMSMGRAIITTDAPGCRETVLDGENGFLVAVGSAEKLAEAMVRFVEQPQLIEAMGKRSRQIAEEKYDVQKVNKVMLQEMGVPL